MHAFAEACLYTLCRVHQFAFNVLLTQGLRIINSRVHRMVWLEYIYQFYPDHTSHVIVHGPRHSTVAFSTALVNLIVGV